MVQSKTIAEKIQDEEYEMSKPLARYADDDDLEKMLKERTREGDPMLMFKKKKKSSITKHIKGIIESNIYSETFIGLITKFVDTTRFVLQSCNSD